jgi:amino acid permease
MDLCSVILVSAILLLVAVGLMISHVRSWRAYQKEELDAEDFDYRRRQLRRRMQTSAMLGLLAVALLVGYVLMVWLHSAWFAAVFWTAVMAVACWVALLAGVDMWATRHHFGRLRHECRVEQAKLEIELRRIQAIRGNGKAATKNEGRGARGEGRGKGR